MAIVYKKLFHFLIDENLKEGEFRKLSGISAPTLGKLKNGGIITTEIIDRICSSLNCQPADIMEYVPHL